MSDIVNRLRQGFKASQLNDWDFERTEADMDEAADTIERLRAALEAVMGDLALLVDHRHMPDVLNDIIYVNARAALEEKA